MSSRQMDKAKDNSRAAFQNRPNMADHVRENLALLNRHSYYQRVIYMAFHANTTENFYKTLKTSYEEILNSCKQNLFNERLTGLFLFYKTQSVTMLEGSEDVLKIFFKHLEKLMHFFKLSKVNLVLNNVNQLFFDRIVWRKAYPPMLYRELMSIDIDDIELTNDILVRKVYQTCTQIALDIDDGASYNLMELPSEVYHNLLPLPTRIEILLESYKVLNLEQLITMSNSIGSNEISSDNVWPMPFDYVPKKFFERNKYDVNITFEEENKTI